MMTIGFVAAILYSSLIAPAFTREDGGPQRVLFVGGTHGNEYNGVFCAKRWGAAPELLLGGLDADGVVQGDTVDVRTLVANPLAFERNRRFLDDDLNRQFSAARLGALSSDADSYEASRARSLAAALAGPSRAPDFVVDLHSTTANMGCTLIVDAWSAKALRCAAYVLRETGGTLKCAGNPPVRILLEPQEDRDGSPFLCSVGVDGMEIELGPTPQGVLRHDLVQAYTEVARHILCFLVRDAAEQQQQQQQQLLLQRARTAAAAPEEEEEGKTAAGGGGETGTAAEPAAAEKAAPPLFAPGETVPVFRYDPTRKLAWPVDGRGFPTAVVHAGLQGRDYEPLVPGQPLFETLQGDTLFFDPAAATLVRAAAPGEAPDQTTGRFAVSSAPPSVENAAGGTRSEGGEPSLSGVFINEGAYYYSQSGVGIGLVRPDIVPVPSPGA